ncbi:MAG TPA: PAS domain S-box protein [Chitinophagaceae bacterium]|nr:PAS domain S-box protein [Chitinophagaceae bacterium]
MQVDAKGNCSEINEALVSILGMNEADNRGVQINVSAFLEGNEKKEFQEKLCHSLSAPGRVIQVKLKFKQENNSSIRVSGEICATNKDYASFIGVIHNDESGLSEAERKTFLEKYQAYEQSAEGIWMFESPEPIPVATDPRKVLEIWKKHSRLVLCNDNMARMYGYEKAEELTNAPLHQFVDFSDEERVDNIFRFIKNGFHLTSVETKEFDKNGNALYFLNSMSGIVENGFLLRVWGTQQDITEKRNIELKLNESEQFYRNLIAESLDGIILTDIDGQLDFISPSATTLIGYEESEIKGANIFEYIHPEERDLAIQSFKREIAKKQDVKFISIRLLKKNGQYLWTMVRGQNMLDNPAVGKIAIYFSDDTLRKTTEEALINSDKKLRMQSTILNSVTDLIVTTDLRIRVTAWNKMIEKMTGITESEALGRNFQDVLRTDYSPYTHKQVHKIVLKEGVWRGEVSFIGADNEKKFLLHNISLIRDDNGSAIGLLGIGKDITERKKAEARVRQSETFYRNLIANSLDGIVMSDQEGTIIYCAPSLPQISLYNIAELLGRNIFDFVHPDDRKEAEITFREELKGKNDYKQMQLRLLTGSGKWVWTLLRAHNLLDNPIFKAVVFYFSNITEQRKLSEKLIEQEVQKQRLLTEATINAQEKERLLIGKELHDNISQQLTTARLYLEVAFDKASGEIKDLVQLSLKNIGGMISEIRSLSQSLVPSTLGDLGLTESIQELCDAIKKSHAFNIDFSHQHFSEEDIPDKMKLMLFRIVQEQFNNIIRHANATIVKIRLQADAENLILSISDNGVGFNPATTRKGMGLNNISGRAALYSGKMELESAPGKGCSLLVIIPLNAMKNKTTE